MEAIINAYACQNCLHELNVLAPACPDCKTSGSVAPKNQVAFFVYPDSHPKPELRYCNRCSFKTIHPLTHCPKCDTPARNLWLGRNAAKLLTRRQGNNSEILIGCLVLLPMLVILPAMLLVFLGSTSDGPVNPGKVLIGMLVCGSFTLLGFGFLLKGIIGRIIG